MRLYVLLSAGYAMLLSATCDETDRVSHSFIDRNLLNRCVTRMFLSPFIVMLIFYGRFNPIGCSPIFLSNKDYYYYYSNER